MMPSCFTQIHRVARKQHKCCECGGIIQPLDVYEYVFGVWDSEPEQFKTCGQCEEARDFYVEHFSELRDEDDGQYTFRSLRSELHEEASSRFLEPSLKIAAYRHIVKMDRRRAAAKTMTGNCK